jgi:hypothetical protein
VTVANPNPALADIQATSGGNLRVGPNDTLTYTYATKVKLGTIKSGWDGATTAVTLSFVDRSPRDAVTVAGVNLGEVTFAQDYIRKSLTVAGTMVATEVGGVTVVTVTVTGTTSNGDTDHSELAGAMIWTPSTAVTDFYFGNPISGAAVTESGALDKDLG